MSNRIPDDMLNAAGFGGSTPAPKPPRIKLTIEMEGYTPQVFQGVCALTCIELGEVGENNAASNWMANVNHISGAHMLASLISTMRENFGEMCIKAALELSRTVSNTPLQEGDKKKDSDATGGG